MFYMYLFNVSLSVAFQNRKLITHKRKYVCTKDNVCEQTVQLSYQFILTSSNTGDFGQANSSFS